MTTDKFLTIQGLSRHALPGRLRFGVVLALFFSNLQLAIPNTSLAEGVGLTCDASQRPDALATERLQKEFKGAAKLDFSDPSTVDLFVGQLVAGAKSLP